jgi:PKD repeat protein/C1A family cysteine protease
MLWSEYTMVQNYVQTIIILCVLLFFSGLSISVTADGSSITDLKPTLAPLNPDYLDWLNQTSPSLKEHATGFVPPPISMDHLKGKNISEMNNRGAYPAQYDLRNQNKLTDVRNQGNFGTCWAFGALSSLESSQMPGKAMNYSEKNMVNRNLWMTGPDTGGNYFKSGGYLLAWLGPVDENIDPYPISTWNYTSPSGPVTSHVQEILWIPPRANSTDLDHIKNRIIANGAVDSSFNWSSPYFNATHNAFYCPTCTSSNHEITLVGWDDTFSRYNFTTTAPGNGAFLLRNSWGPDWGDRGYAWISYYDPVIGKYNAQFIESDTDNYSGIYQYDPAGASTFFGSSVSGWGGNVFTAISDAELSAVGFYTYDLPVRYDLRIYKNPTNGPIGDTILSQKSGTIEMAGYHTVGLDTPVSLTKGTHFSIVIHLTDSNVTTPLAMEYPTSGQPWNATAGQGYFSNDGSRWYDLVDYWQNASICIKGYTKDQSSPPSVNFTANRTSGTIPLSVQFTDLSIGDPISWLWNFGDGGSSIVQNPVYTYTKAGSFTVNLTASNNAGSDSKAVSNYISTQNPVILYTISATAGSGGRMIPNGTVTVLTGGNQTFTITPDSGYIISDVLVDRGSVGAVSSYTFPNVTANHTISALFSSVPVANYTITATAGSGGRIIPNGTAVVPSGRSQTFNIVPDSGYIISDVVVDSGSVGGVSSYTFPNVTANHAIFAAFSSAPVVNYTINATAGSGGRIIPNGTVIVPSYGNQAFTIVPDSGYIISDVFVDGGRVGAVSGYTIQNVTANHTINARFSNIPGQHTINAIADSWTINYPSGKVTYPEGANQTQITQPKPGVDLLNVTVDNLSQGAISSWTFTNITADHIISTEGAPTPGQVHVFFNATPRYGQMPLTVNFTDQSLGLPTSWYWQFGDGTTSTIQNVSHVYSTPGAYTVTLKCQNNQTGGYGVWHECVMVTRESIPEPTQTGVPEEITASFTAVPDTGIAPLDVWFEDQTSGNPTSWNWYFGDGGTSTVQNMTHRYSTPGRYSVSLQAQNSKNGSSITKKDLIQVT